MLASLDPMHDAHGSGCNTHSVPVGLANCKRGLTDEWRPPRGRAFLAVGLNMQDRGAHGVEMERGLPRQVNTTWAAAQCCCRHERYVSDGPYMGASSVGYAGRWKRPGM